MRMDAVLRACVAQAANAPRCGRCARSGRAMAKRLNDDRDEMSNMVALARAVCHWPSACPAACCLQGRTQTTACPTSSSPYKQCREDSAELHGYAAAAARPRPPAPPAPPETSASRACLFSSDDPSNYAKDTTTIRMSACDCPSQRFSHHRCKPAQAHHHCRRVDSRSARGIHAAGRAAAAAAAQVARLARHAAGLQRARLALAL